MTDAEALVKGEKNFLGVYAALLLVVLVWLPQLLILTPSTSYGDEGLVAQSARRIAQGQIPYRDFFCMATPGSFYWSAGFLAVFGKTFLALRLSALVTFSLILAGATLLLRRLNVRDLQSYLIVLSFLAFSCGYWFVVSHHWVSLACCLLSLALLIQPGEAIEKMGCSVMLAGVFAALAAFSLQHKGAVWIVAASIALCFGQPDGKLGEKLKKFWFGILLASLPMVLFFVSSGGLRQLIDQLVLFPLRQYHNLPGHQTIPVFKDLFLNWKNVSASLPDGLVVSDYLKYITWNVGFLGRVIVHFLIFPGLWALISLWRHRDMPRRNVALLTAFFVAMYLSTLYRIHETTLFFAAPAAVIVIAVALESAGKIRSEGRRPNRLFSVAGEAWIGLFTAICFGFFLIFLFVPTYTVKMPAGLVVSQFEEEAKTLQDVNNFMRLNRKEGEPIFCYSYNPIFYFLLDVDNPTPYDILTFPMNTQAQLDEAQALLEKTKCRWIVWDYNSLWTDSFGQYLAKYYKTKLRAGNVAIMEREEVQKYSLGHL